MKKTIFISIMVFAALVLSVSCSGSPKTQKKDSYTVTFDLKGGKCEGLDAKQPVKAGDTVDEPVFVPAASDDKYYRFDYWAKADGTEYSFSTPVTSDITLYAKYKERYTVGEKDSPSGGYTFYENKNYVQGSTDPDKNWKYLEVSSKDYWDNSPTDTTFEWGTKGESIETSTAVNSGSSNTEKMSELTSSVAKNIWNQTLDGGKTDWYIPSKDELALIFKEIAAKGNGNFSGYYWSSSANGNDSAWNLSSAESASGEHSDSRDAKCHIRLIRKF